MKTTIWGHAAPAVRKLLNFAAPALVVGLLLGSQAYGIVYPPGAVGRLERNIDGLLLKEQNDIVLETALVQTQAAIGRVIDVLNTKLQNATDPNEIARLQQQIAAKQAQFNQFQTSIDANGRVLQRNLTVVNPAKDNALRQLAGVRQNQKQIAMYIRAASLREATYVRLMQNFLKAHPVTPLAPF